MTSKSKSEQQGASQTELPVEIEVDASDPVEIEVEAADPAGGGEESSEEVGAAPAGSLEERVAALEAEKAELEQKGKETFDRLLRATADLENFRKRSRRDVEEARIEARSRVLREILPVLDNLERAVAHAGDASGDTGAIVEGVTLVLRQFAQALERVGVTPIEALGTPFDPNVHEAVGQVETGEQPPGTVVEVLQNGYRIGERLLRPALVVVSKAPAKPAGEEVPDGEARVPLGNGEDTTPLEANGEDKGGTA